MPVYFTLIPQHHTRRFSLLLMRLDVATGHPSLSPAAPTLARWEATRIKLAVLVFVTSHATGRMTRRLVARQPLDGNAVLAGDSASPASALVAVNTNGDRTLVERIAQTGAASPLITIPNSLPLSFEPTGTRLLYLAGDNPPTLTEATIANGQLTTGPWRNPHLNLAALAW